MTRSRRTDPRPIRAVRRATFPVVRARHAGRGRHHPASASDVRNALRAFGEKIYYGLASVELVPAPVARTRLPLGRLIGPGRIVLYDQALSPWRLGFELPRRERARLLAAGARSDKDGIVSWPGDSLRRFMLGYVLAHELGHHILQHERRLRGEPGARTSDHESRAEAIATKLRALLD
jgi:hypothetical protein